MNIRFSKFSKTYIFPREKMTTGGRVDWFRKFNARLKQEAEKRGIVFLESDWTVQKTEKVGSWLSQVVTKQSDTIWCFEELLDPKTNYTSTNLNFLTPTMFVSQNTNSPSALAWFPDICEVRNYDVSKYNPGNSQGAEKIKWTTTSTNREYVR